MKQQILMAVVLLLSFLLFFIEQSVATVDSDPESLDIDLVFLDVMDPKECGWPDAGTYGAPVPYVTTQRVSYSDVFVTLMMAIHPTNPNIQYYITDVPYRGDITMFDRFYPSMYDFRSSMCSLGFNTYLDLNSFNTKFISNDSLIIELSKTIYAHYVDKVEKTVYSFSDTILLYGSLGSHATTTVNTIADNQEVPLISFTIDSVYPTENNHITIASRLSLKQVGYILENLSVQSAPQSFTTSFQATPSNNRIYSVGLTTVEKNVIVLTGDYLLQATVRQESTGIAYSHLIPFDLKYSNMIPSSPLMTNMSFTTFLILKDELGVTRRDFSSGEQIYVTSAIGRKSFEFDFTNQILRVDNAYVCCMKNNAPMPVYDPSNGQYGCTVENKDTMDKWIQPVRNSIPQSYTATQLLMNSKNSNTISFNANSLIDNKNKVCYLHVHNYLDGIAQKRSMLSRSSSEDESSHSFGLIQIGKSLSSGSNSIIQSRLNDIYAVVYMVIVLVTIL